MTAVPPLACSFFLALCGVSLLPPLVVALRDGESAGARAFALPAAAVFAAAAVAFFAHRRLRATSRAVVGGGPAAPNPRAAVVAVGAAWTAVCLFGAVPLRLSGSFPRFVDALFESTSGFTTTGATVLADVESVSRSVNLWRCETHWLGGMGVIALAVALVPFLGIGGLRLLNAESTGPEKGKLTARIMDTARTLWLLYVGLTALQTCLLRLCGMTWFESACHAFSTLGTGGFSTRNASLAAFASPAAEWVCTIFMLVAALNFGVYYRLLARKGEGLRSATEPRAFAAVVAAAAAIATVALARAGEPVGRAFRLAAFQVSSIVSTTGFASADFDLWPPAAKMVLFALLFIGGCSGSTAGGVKAIRWAVLAKEALAGMRRFLHPRVMWTSRIDGRPAPEGLAAGVAGFVAAYLALVGAVSLAGAFAGLHPWESFTAALSMVGNVGPAFGSLGPAGNYGALSPALKLCHSFAMLAGRLEIFTMFAFLGWLFRFPSVRSTP